MSWLRPLEAVFDLVYPPGLSCPCCGGLLPRGLEDTLCPDCEAALVPFDAARICPWCGGLHAATLCAPFHEPLNDLHCALYHRETARTLVHALKYRSLREAAAPLAIRMAALIQPSEWDALVPLPLHKRREQERGFNQARLLAEGIAEETSLPVMTPLIRIRPTDRQVGLSRDARFQNVAGAFACTSPVSGLRLLMVDDVFTTGATAKSAGQALREAGAKRVGVLTATHASDDR